MDKSSLQVRTWDVVLFITEKKVEYLPSSWRVHNRTDMYMWPIVGLSKIKKLLKECHPPDINIQFQEYEGVCKATVDNVEMAEELVKNCSLVLTFPQKNRLQKKNPMRISLIVTIIVRIPSSLFLNYVFIY